MAQPRPPAGPQWFQKPLGGGDGTGLLLGLVAYTVGLNFIRNGKAGVDAWFSAKFLNKVKEGSW